MQSTYLNKLGTLTAGGITDLIIDVPYWAESFSIKWFSDQAAQNIDIKQLAGHFVPNRSILIVRVTNTSNADINNSWYGGKIMHIRIEHNATNSHTYGDLIINFRGLLK